MMSLRDMVLLLALTLLLMPSHVLAGRMGVKTRSAVPGRYLETADCPTRIHRRLLAQVGRLSTRRRLVYYQGMQVIAPLVKRPGDEHGKQKYRKGNIVKRLENGEWKVEF